MLKKSAGFLSSIKNMNDFANIFTLDFSIFRHDHEVGNYPNWMIRYFETLTTREQWDYFMAFRKVEAQLNTPVVFIDKLKWILKSETIELEYDFYLHVMVDPDSDIGAIFKPGCFKKLYLAYNERFEKEFYEAFSPTMKEWESISDFSEDDLPF